MIVHDLNNPLSGIIGYLSFIPDELLPSLSTSQKDAFAIMQINAWEMRNMISDLLDIDKMEEGKFKLQYDDVDIDALFKQIGDSMKILGKDENKVLSFDTSPGLTVWADRTILKRIVSNLIGNAIKFASPNSTIFVSGRHDDDSGGLLVSVKDMGKGIAKEYLSRVFEKFVQVESAQEQGRIGKGLGLTFCKMAVEAHKGKIWVESQLGEGSTFYFVLPGKGVKDKVGSVS
jgi:signal transduction histidine kinase